MRISKLLLFSGVLSVQAAALNTTFPSCAVACNEDVLASCSLSRAECFCNDHSINPSLLSCVSSNCTTKELFTSKRIYEQECSITPLQGPSEAQASTIIPFILASIFFVIRMLAKGYGLAGGWGWDDYTIIVSYIMGLAIFVVNIYLIRFGFGRNIWDIDFDTITKFYKYFQAIAAMYKIQISLAKISVCLFLLRIFQTPAFRTAAYSLISINAAIGITWALVDSLRCLPAHLTWDGWTNEEQGKCINFIISILINCLVNIFVDTALIIMPVYEVSKLQLRPAKKVSVVVMFAVGSVLTVIAIIRLIVFWNNRWGQNQTLGLYPLIHWSVIECQVAVMCACLPASRALFEFFFPGLLAGSSRRTTNGTGAGPTTWSNANNINFNIGGNSQISKQVACEYYLN
ncbi:hypothetical protein MW887_011464 [Aspergillus wentii]|nr:hypothetical protein MW887_011464 [Aspergillus wentii]